MNNNHYYTNDTIRPLRALAISIGIMVGIFFLCTLICGCSSVRRYGPTVVHAWFDLSGTNKVQSVETPVDAVPFGDLVWAYGGFNASGAVLDTPRLSGASCNGRRYSYKWDVGLSGWGLGNDEAGAICAVFIERDGKWIGGKFDWISTSRASRELKHLESYSTWPKSGIKLPVTGRVAFVVTSADGKRRSNVIVAEVP